MLLSEESYRKIEKELAKFPATKKRSAAIAALTIAQDEKGWLSPEVMQEIADYLGVPAVAIEEVATFYSMFNTRPVGKTPDGLFTLVESECMGACGDGPVILVNNKNMYMRMSKDKIDKLLEELK